jgi:hypothetical protein
MTKTTYWLSSIAAEVDNQTTLWSDELLGLSPAELDHYDLSEAEREPKWVGHQGCPEMNLDNVYDIGRI